MLQLAFLVLVCTFALSAISPPSFLGPCSFACSHATATLLFFLFGTGLDKEESLGYDLCVAKDDAEAEAT